LAITHFNLKLNPCRFSIFYCGCKQPKSVHILKLRAKVRFFVETSAVFLPKLLRRPLSTPLFPIFANPKPQITSSFINHRSLRFCRSHPSSPSHRSLRFCRSHPSFPFLQTQPPCASVLPKPSLDSSDPFLWFH